MTSRQTTALVEAKLDELQYARWNLSGVNLNAGLKSAVASVRLTSDNELLKMQSEADLRLDRKYMDGRLNMKVEELGTCIIWESHPNLWNIPLRSIWERRTQAIPLSCRWMPAIWICRSVPAARWRSCWGSRTSS